MADEQSALAKAITDAADTISYSLREVSEAIGFLATCVSELAPTETVEETSPEESIEAAKRMLAAIDAKIAERDGASV